MESKSNIGRLGVELTQKEREALRKADPKVLKAVVDKYIQRLNAAYLDGTETQEGAAGKQFYQLRNFLYYWKIILRAIEDENKSE